MEILKLIDKAYLKTVEWLVFILFSVTIFSTSLGVVTRNVTFIPTLTWTEELTRYSVIAGVFLVAGLGMRRGVHLGMTLLLDKLPQSASKVLQFINILLMIAFLTIIAYAGFSMAMSNMSQTSVALRIPMGIPFLAIPVGAVLILIELVRSLILLFKNGGQTT